MRYVLKSAKASPSRPTGISKRSPPAQMKHTINVGSAIIKRIVASTFVRLHATLNTRPNTLMNSHTNRTVQIISNTAYLDLVEQIRKTQRAKDIYQQAEILLHPETSGEFSFPCA